MPDKYRFDHLPTRGLTVVRCVDCDAGGPIYGWPERARKRHQERHRRDAARELERKQRASLAEGRRLRALAERENTRVYKAGAQTPLWEEE